MIVNAQKITADIISPTKVPNPRDRLPRTCKTTLQMTSNMATINAVNMGYSQWDGFGGHVHEKRQKQPYLSSLTYDQIETGREKINAKPSPLLNSLPRQCETMKAWAAEAVKSSKKNNVRLFMGITTKNESPTTANKARQFSDKMPSLGSDIIPGFELSDTPECASIWSQRSPSSLNFKPNAWA